MIHSIFIKPLNDPLILSYSANAHVVILEEQTPNRATNVGLKVITLNNSFHLQIAMTG